MLYDCTIYLKFKRRQNLSLVMKVRMVVTFGGGESIGWKGAFWGTGHVLNSEW